MQQWLFATTNIGKYSSLDTLCKKVHILYYVSAWTKVSKGTQFYVFIVYELLLYMYCAPVKVKLFLVDTVNDLDYTTVLLS